MRKKIRFYPLDAETGALLKEDFFGKVMMTLDKAGFVPDLFTGTAHDPQFLYYVIYPSDSAKHQRARRILTEYHVMFEEIFWDP
jgi:thioester reductase-like protein